MSVNRCRIETSCNFTCSGWQIIDETSKTIAASRKRSADRLHKVDRPHAKTIAPQKRPGDNIDGPSKKRLKNNEMELVGGHTKVVTVRLYKNRLDWDHIREARVSCGDDEELDLEEVSSWGWKGGAA